MIFYGKQSIGQSDIDAVVEVLKSDFLTQGPAIEKFEKYVAEYCGVKYAVAVTNATSALHIACLAAGLGKGDVLWTSPITFTASANCGRYCGADVDFVDIDPSTYNMSVDELEKKLQKMAGNNKAAKNKKNKKNNKKRKNILTTFILLISITALCLVIGIYYRDNHKQKKDDNTVVLNVDSTLETLSVDPERIKSAILEHTTRAAENYEYPNSFSLDIPFVSQYPELPTGCEITSLTEVLNYLGYGIDKETLARNYLDMRDTVTQGCFVEYFWGSPWKTTGSGCFAPAIANAANSFLKSQNSSYSAYIMSYSPVEDLFTELSLGHPVIVWTSYNYNDPEVKYNDVTLDDGTVFTWPRNEHCAALAGYDIDRGVVTLADPTYGIVERSMEEFVTYYQKYYYQAVVVR